MEKKEASGVISYFSKNTKAQQRQRNFKRTIYLPAIRHHPTVCHSLRNVGINNSNNTWESQS